ncbi:MAG: MerR family transcriptional regulator [Reyranella sp.]
MPIGALSKKSGVHIETIRYYERAGVLPKARRTSNGRRTYGQEDANRLAFIRHARDLGFDLTAVRALLTLQERPELSCEAASKMASAQLSAVESRLTRLAVLRDELKRMVRACRNGRVAECRVIDALTKMP